MDQGTRFMSDCMQEVSRLLSIKGLASAPYHPICNGLVERWNGTLKSMLKRLCQDQPKQWHRLINPVLLAYREVPRNRQDLVHFSCYADIQSEDLGQS